MTRYEFSSDNAKMDVLAIHAYLSQSYWAKDISLAVVEKSVKNSLCFGVFLDQHQVGFARVITDSATFAYLADVYILASHRGRGLSKKLLEMVVEHPDLQGLRRTVLATKDAHGLYEKYGFSKLADPDLFMEQWNPDIYKT